MDTSTAFTRDSMRRRFDCRRLAILLAMAPTLAAATGSLGIPDQINGYPTNVGFLILGHSTSAQGQYPAKLVSALNHASHTEDARHYSAFNAITGGDGGLLWSLVSVAPGDIRHARATASQAVGESPNPQWCESADTQRWSCRRAKVEQLLLGANPIPASGSCADVSVVNSCRLPSLSACTWYDRTLPLNQNPVTQQLSLHDCWLKMDYRIALIQDTSNRSWPVDDYNGDGQLDASDHWLASRIRARALPCPTSSGVIGSSVDWNCDLALDSGDSAAAVYAGWLRELSTQLLDATRYGASALDFVFISVKPVEMGQCSLWPTPESTICQTNPHAMRTPAQIAATPSRPFDHYFVPTVQWELRVIEALFADPALDPRIHATTPGQPGAMLARSANCYGNGQSGADWSIPAAAPSRPTTVAPDDSETDGAGGNADSEGCMIGDHVHHNDSGGWMMADVWFSGLADPLWAGMPELVFASGFE